MSKRAGTRSSALEEGAELRLLRDHDVLVQPGYFYDFEKSDYVVISLLTPAEVFQGRYRTNSTRVKPSSTEGGTSFAAIRSSACSGTMRPRGGCGPCRPQAAHRRTALRSRTVTAAPVEKRPAIAARQVGGVDVSDRPLQLRGAAPADSAWWRTRGAWMVWSVSSSASCSRMASLEMGCAPRFAR